MIGAGPPRGAGRASASARCSSTRARASACCPPATSWSRPASRSRPGQIRDSNRATLLALVAQTGLAGRRPRAHPRRRGRHHRRPSRDGAATCDAVHHQRRRVDGRHRPREGGARPHRRHAVDADRHPAGQAVRVRAASATDDAGVRAARATRCRRWSASSCWPAPPCGGWPGTPSLLRARGAGGRRRAVPPATRRQGPLRAGAWPSGTPTACSTCARPAARAPTTSPPWPAPRPCCPLPDGDGVDAGDAVRVLLLADI